MMTRAKRAGVGLMFLLGTTAPGIVGCDAKGKVCQSGEGVDALGRWGACNESCAGKDNQESCAAAKVYAGPACEETVKKGKPNHAACRQACENGVRPACAVK